MELKKSKLALTLASVLSAGFVSTSAMAADSLTNLYEGGKASVAFNARYEAVDDSVNKDASALTLKTSLTLTTGEVSGFSGSLELENITALMDDYAPETAGYAVVADPEEDLEVNQAFIKYKNESFTATYGRQVITNLNQRFIGHVGWRQNKQTFDAVRLQAKLGAVDLDYFYITNVNTIVATNVDVKSHNLLASYKVAENQTLSGFAYLYEPEATGVSTDTYGVDYSAKFGGVGVKASYAIQSMAAFDADYISLEASYAASGFSTALGYEVLGSDGGLYGFQTPLATKHAFNGWADKFLGTPATGLQDIYGKLGYKAGAFSIAGFYHIFAADSGSADYGTEFDLVSTYKINDNFSVLAKYAAYSADDLSTDTDKVWLQVTAKF